MRVRGAILSESAVQSVRRAFLSEESFCPERFCPKVRFSQCECEVVLQKEINEKRCNKWSVLKLVAKINRSEFRSRLI